MSLLVVLIAVAFSAVDAAARKEKGTMLRACRYTWLCNESQCLGDNYNPYSSNCNGSKACKSDMENWKLVYWVKQKGQPNNPYKAVYGDNWNAVKKAYPWVDKASKGVVKSLADSCELNVSKKWSPSKPYTRVCVPTAKGLAKGMKKTDFLMNLNPADASTDATASTFYKAYIRDGKVWNGFCADKMH